MSDQSGFADLSQETKDRLKKLWTDVAEVQELPPQTATAQFLARGRNIRLNLRSAITAALETAHAVVAGTKVWVNPYDFTAWLEATGETVTAIQSILASLVQNMQPIDYVAAIVLSQQVAGLTPEELRTHILEFLNTPRLDEYGWYLGMSKDRFRRAHEVVQSDHWFDLSRSRLEKDGFIEEVGEKLVFRSKNITWGWKST